MCPPLGLARNVSESERFRTKINTILADDHFGISAPLECDRLIEEGYVFLTHFLAKGTRFGRILVSQMMRGFDVDFLPKGTRFRPTFWLRVHVFDAFWCPK